MSSEIFTQLVDAHYTPLFRFALSLTKNPSDAGDLTQQTFFIWAKQGHALREEAKAKSWLFTTLYREFLRIRRRGERMTALEVDMVTGMDAGLVVEALQEVDEVYRVPLTLFYMQDLSYKEIADMIEAPIGTVMSRLSRGKAQLRTALARKEAGPRGKVVPFQTNPARKHS
jgi:RNA polymerase sigma-70 factor (ECF subfamily)